MTGEVGTTHNGLDSIYKERFLRKSPLAEPLVDTEPQQTIITDDRTFPEEEKIRVENNRIRARYESYLRVKNQQELHRKKVKLMLSVGAIFTTSVLILYLLGS